MVVVLGWWSLGGMEVVRIEWSIKVMEKAWKVVVVTRNQKRKWRATDVV